RRRTGHRPEQFRRGATRDRVAGHGGSRQLHPEDSQFKAGRGEGPATAACRPESQTGGRPGRQAGGRESGSGESRRRTASAAAAGGAEAGGATDTTRAGAGNAQSTAGRTETG